MQYKVYAVEIETGLPFEQYCENAEAAERLIGSLRDGGYQDISKEEAYSSLDEMYEDVKKIEEQHKNLVSQIAHYAYDLTNINKKWVEVIEEYRNDFFQGVRRNPHSYRVYWLENSSCFSVSQLKEVLEKVWNHA